MTTKRSIYRLGTTVTVDGVPHNVVAVNRRNGRVTKVTIASWAGARTTISDYKFRKLTAGV